VRHGSYSNVRMGMQDQAPFSAALRQPAQSLRGVGAGAYVCANSAPRASAQFWLLLWLIALICCVT
jgi:hypothetical protein